MDNLKVTPYQRLKGILNEGDLTDRASQNLDDLLGVKKETKETFLDKIFKFFRKIDSFIFKKGSTIMNTTPYKRKR